MKLTISRATFSQFNFDAQKTRHESLGITSDTRITRSFNLPRVTLVRFLPKPTNRSGSLNKCCFEYWDNKKGVSMNILHTDLSLSLYFEVQPSVFDQFTRVSGIFSIDFVDNVIDLDVFFQFDLGWT